MWGWRYSQLLLAMGLSGFTFQAHLCQVAKSALTEVSSMAMLQGSGCACMLSHFGYVQLFVTIWTVAHQAFLFMRFPPPGDLPNPEIEPVPPVSPALAGGFFTTSTIWEAHRFQDTLPQTMKHWHIKHFKLKKFEKWQEHEGLCPSPESGHKTLNWEVPPVPIPEERNIPFSASGMMLEGIWRNSACSVFSNWPPSAHTLCPVSFPQLSILYQT